MSRPTASHRSLTLFTVLLAITLLAPSAAAQLGAGQIEGTVTDSSGALITGAAVTITNAETGVTRALATDASGRYRAVALQPGTYKVRVEHEGFAPREGNVVVSVGSTTTANLSLAVGGAQESMEVEAVAPAVDTEKTDVTNTVSNNVVENVPVTARRWENYVLLTPGVTNDGTFGLISYRGISGLYNNNSLDGADNNQAFFSEARGRDRVIYTYSQSSIKEFQVGLSNFNAEMGRAAGGAVNAVTKSGGNDFHGQAFYFIRDDATSARDPFIVVSTVQAAIGKDKLPERRQMFGLSAGGPLVRDRAFWFISYDQVQRNFPYVVDFNSVSFVPDDCSTLPNINQQATCEWFQSERTVVPRKGYNNIALAKLDWNINNNHNLTTYFNFHQWRSPNGTRTPAINRNAASDNAFNKVRTDTFHTRWNYIINANVLNEVRFQYAFDRDSFIPNAPGPGTSVTGGFSFGQPDFLPRLRYPFEKRFQWVDNLSWTTGRHAFKFGGDINYVREDLINLFQGGGVYSYSSFVNLAGDCPPGAVPLGCVPDGTPSYSTYFQAFDSRVLSGDLPADRAGAAAFTTTDWNFYAQDTWKIRPDLTLNYGVRYEYQQLPQPDTPNPALPNTARINQDTNNWGPRLGLAWNIGGSSRNIMRAGYGLVYGRSGNHQIFSALRDNGFLTAALRFTPSTPGAPIYPNCFQPGINSTCTLPTPSLTGGAADVLTLAPDFARPMVHQVQFSLEREVFKDTIVSATYAFSGGRRLPVFTDVNLPDPGSQIYIFLDADHVVNGETLATSGVYGPFPFWCVSLDCSNTLPGNGRPNPNFGSIIETQTVANSNYHGLILRLARRMRQGFMVDTHFTWARAMDNGQNSTTFISRFGSRFDPTNPRLDYGRGNLDVRRRFVATFVWAPDEMWQLSNEATKKVLGGWRFSGTGSLSDGRPVTPISSGSLSSAANAINTSSLNGVGGSQRAPFVSRNFVDSPGYANFDLRVSRSITITESTRLEVIAEAFNLFNRTNVTTVDTFAYNHLGTTRDATALTTCAGSGIALGERCARVTPRVQSGTTRATFLDPRAASSTLGGKREFQFAFKFHW